MGENETLPKIIEASEISFINESWIMTLAQRKREVQRSNRHHRPFIAVFGSAMTNYDSRDWKRAFDVGAALAKGGAVVMNGGYGGIMEASAAGAKSQDGITVGITCRNLPEARANNYITHDWPTDRWDQRLLGLVWLADGYIVMPGSSGTLVELAMVIETQLKGFIPIRPVACMGVFWKPVVQRITQTANIIEFTSTPVKAAAHVLGINIPKRIRRSPNRMK
jgi:uncharacterized protein (TIGR00725 family)